MDEDWTVTAVTAKMKDRAWWQLGTSGSGNHFVEVGELTVTDAGVGLQPGRYVALLSHSGTLARFEPRLVEMAPSGEPPEDESFSCGIAYLLLGCGGVSGRRPVAYVFARDLGFE